MIRSNTIREALSRLRSSALRAGSRSAALGAVLLLASTATVLATANTRPTITTATVTPNVIKEGEKATLNFAFTDPDVADYHALRVRWRDGGTPYTVQHNVPFGQHSMQLDHTFLDDNQSAETYWKSIRVTLYDRQAAPGQNPNDNTGDAGPHPYIDIPITVKNAPPAFVDRSLKVTKTPIKGGGTKVAIEGRVTDPGAKDVLAVTTYFSDPSAPGYVPCTMGDNTRSFVCEHTYPATSKAGDYWIPFSVKDDDGGEGVYQTIVKLP